MDWPGCIGIERLDRGTKAGRPGAALKQPRRAPVPEACAHLARAIELVHTATLPPPTSTIDVDVLATAFSSYSIALTLKGEPVEARRHLEAIFESPWMELRSAILFGSLALRTGKKGKARALLGKLCGQFSGVGAERRVGEARRALERLR